MSLVHFETRGGSTLLINPTDVSSVIEQYADGVYSVVRMKNGDWYEIYGTALSIRTKIEEKR